MNFVEKITGNDMTKELKTYELRAKSCRLIIKKHGKKLRSIFGHNQISPVATSCQFLTLHLNCSKKRRRTARVSKRFWVTISKAFVQRWQAKKGQSFIVTSGASNSTIISLKN